MKKLRIGIDFDDVLFSSREAVHSFHNKNYGTNVCKEQMISYDLTEIWKCTREEMHARIRDFFISNEHNQMEPIPGAIDAIHKLSVHHELFIITARPPEAEEMTKQLLSHFNKNGEISGIKIFKKIHFTGTITGENIILTKAEVCKSESIDIFIDDHDSNTTSVSLSGIPSLLLDQPWNRNEPLPNGVKRVYSWGDILNEIDQITLV